MPRRNSNPKSQHASGRIPTPETMSLYYIKNTARKSTFKYKLDTTVTKRHTNFQTKVRKVFPRANAALFLSTAFCGALSYQLSR